MVINKIYPLAIYWLRGVFVLLFNIIEDISEVDNSFFKRRKKRVLQPVRENLRINNNTYTIVHMNRNNINDSFVKRILMVNRGRTLKCDSEEINIYISEYLLDIRPYIKRAILAALLKEMPYNNSFSSLCIYDDEFRLNDEYFDIAEKARTISIIGENKTEIELFRHKCYHDLGLIVDCSDKYCELYHTSLDLNDIMMNKSAFLSIDGCKMLIYADESYFNVDDNVSQLLKYNVPIEYACASLNMRS